MFKTETKPKENIMTIRTLKAINKKTGETKSFCDCDCNRLIKRRDEFISDMTDRGEYWTYAPVSIVSGI